MSPGRWHCRKLRRYRRPYFTAFFPLTAEGHAIKTVLDDDGRVTGIDYTVTAPRQSSDPYAGRWQDAFIARRRRGTP